MPTLIRQLHRARVSVALVTHDSRRYIGRCLDALLRHAGMPIEVVVVDNASTDGTREILAAFADRVHIVHNGRNLGFAAAQNQALALGRAEWVLALNPDVLLLPGFLPRLLEAAAIDPGVGSVCGRLLSIGPDFEPFETPRIDSTGIYFTPAMRHFDRGWHERDNGQFRRMEYVFGASAAAALYRREMIEDVSCGGEFFDPDFFAYREDADVAWRAQWLGWRCLYTPEAVAYHVRSVVPDKRRGIPAALNMHSVKNRFLMRIKNMTPGLYRRYWLPATARDLLVVAGCVLTEPASLPAFWHLAGCLRRTLARRREIMRRRRVTDDAMAQWFQPQPSSLPLPDPAAPVALAGAPLSCGD